MQIFNPGKIRRIKKKKLETNKWSKLNTEYTETQYKNGMCRRCIGGMVRYYRYLPDSSRQDIRIITPQGEIFNYDCDGPEYRIYAHFPNEFMRKAGKKQIWIEINSQE